MQSTDSRRLLHREIAVRIPPSIQFPNNDKGRAHGQYNLRPEGGTARSSAGPKSTSPARTRTEEEVSKVEEAIIVRQQAERHRALKAAEPVLARTGQKGVVHKKTASRKISRLTKRVKGDGVV